LKRASDVIVTGVIHSVVCGKIEICNLPVQFIEIISFVQTGALKIHVASGVSLTIQLIFFLIFLLLA
jgi:hypothetical protein